MDKMKLKKVLDEKGMDWLVAAMVEGSIGYHSPPGARRLIEGALAGETKDYCERCLACFKSDLLQMIESDIEGMRYTEEKNPKKFKLVMDTVRQIASLDAQGQTVAGLMFPTMGI
jgi:hypothetical protein